MNELNQFNTGGTHESNPLGGIPMGIGENGQMNTVEENETMQNDFVFSDRIVLRPDVISQVGLPKTLANKTVAEATKLIDKQFKDRTSKIDKSTRDSMFERIAQAQEMIKSEEQAKIAAAQEMNSTEVPDMMGGQIPQGMDQFMQPKQGMEQLPMEDQDGRIQSGMQDLGQPMFRYGGKVNKYFLGGPTEEPVAETEGGTSFWGSDAAVAITDSGIHRSKPTMLQNIGFGLQNNPGIVGAGLGTITNTGMMVDALKGNTSENTGKAALSGATTGAMAGSIAGPIGSAVGAGIGAITGVIGSKKAKRKARQEAENRERKEFYDTYIGSLSNNDDTQVFALGGQIDPKKKHKRSLLERLRDDVRNTDRNRQIKENKEWEEKSPMKENWQGWYKHYTNFKRTEKTNQNSRSYLNTAPFRNLENFLNSQKTVEETNPYITGLQPYAYGGRVNKYQLGGNPTDPFYNTQNAQSVKDFQTWVHGKYGIDTGGIDGIAGRKTRPAYTQYGNEYEAYRQERSKPLTSVYPQMKTAGIVSPEITPGNVPNYTYREGTDTEEQITPQNRNYGNLLRYAPVAMNTYQLATLKGPQTNRLQRLNNQYQRQFLDEATYQNIAREQASAARNAIGRSGATTGQMIGAQLGTQLGASKAIADSYNQIRQHNIGENRLRQQTAWGNNQFNIQQDNLEQDINDRNKANYQTQRSKLLGQLGNDLGGIGREEVYKDMAKEATGYDWMGNYLKANPNATKADAEKAYKKANPKATKKEIDNAYNKAKESQNTSKSQEYQNEYLNWIIDTKGAHKFKDGAIDYSEFEKYRQGKNTNRLGGTLNRKLR